MNVTPIAEVLIFSKIFITDVETADIAKITVDDAELSVISIVDAEVDAEFRGEERFDFPAVGEQVLEVFVPEPPRSYCVIEESDT